LFCKNYFTELNNCLNSIQISITNGSVIPGDAGINQWCKMTSKIVEKGNTMFFIGNGASAMMASHMAADACKNGGIKALAFNDAALLTAVSNDICYEQAFALPLIRFASSNDVLVAISSSGNSPNIVAAINVARDLSMKVVTLTGMQPDNISRSLGDLNIYVPADSYGLVEAAHQAILHCWLDMYMQNFMEAI
jgi:D-sedoheptulose 7-phosphate isomerase